MQVAQTFKFWKWASESGFLFLSEKETYYNRFAIGPLALWLISPIFASCQGGTMNDFIYGFIYGHHWGRAAGTMTDFCHGCQGGLWMTLPIDAIDGGEQSYLKQNSNMKHDKVLLDWCVLVSVQLRVICLGPAKAKSKQLAHANGKTSVLKIYKTTTWIMATYILHITSGSLSLSLSILQQETVHEYFINWENSCRMKENKNLNHIPYLDRSWMKIGFGVFL